MAIVQISRITNRKGLQENLPQLAGAELGWSIDERRLYIGNGTLQEGAPVIGNTEILTEFSDILEFQTLYTYKGEAAGYTVQTGPDVGSPVTLSLQSWMDQFASVLDFGATGDGVTDDTDAINRALYQLYCRETNVQIRRSLFFPAGVYRISGSINIPPYATLIGEGIDNTIIQLVATDDSTLHECVARTADSQQQIGVDIGDAGATPPQYITVSNLQFQSLDPTVDIFIMQDATNCKFTNVAFEGPLTTGDLDTDADDIRAVAFASTVTFVCNQIVFDSCRFTGTTYGTEISAAVKSITFTNSQFDTLYQGVVLRSSATGVRITGNQFDNVYAEGILFASSLTPALNASGHNIFYDVGNNFLGTGNPATPVIDIQSNDNISISDLISRSPANAAIQPRVKINNALTIVTNNGKQLFVGAYKIVSGQSNNLINDITSNILQVNALLTKAFVFNYTINRNNAYRTGTIMVTSDVGGTSAGLSFSDDYVQNDDTGVTLTVEQTGDTIFVNYTANELGVNGTITSNYTFLA